MPDAPAFDPSQPFQPAAQSAPAAQPAAAPAFNPSAPWSAYQYYQKTGGAIPVGEPSMPSDWDQAKALIEPKESGGRNVPNYRYDATHTASGYLQITDTNWNAYAPKAGVDLKQYPNAMSAPRDVQENVGKKLYEERGLQPWSESLGPKTKGANWNVSPAAIASEQSAGADVRYMSPADYLAMTPELPEDASQSAKRKSLMKSLDAGEDIEAIPTLDVKSKGDKLVVYDQDGRNRALAAQEAGVDLIPVAIKGVPASGAPTQIQGMRGGEARPFNFAKVGKVEPPRSALAGIGEGLADPIYGGAQLLSHMLPSGVTSAINAASNKLAEAGLPIAPVPEGGMDQVTRQREADIAASRPSDAGFDVPRAAGNVLGGVASAVAAPEIFGAGSLGRLAVAAGAQGALSPVTDGGNFPLEKSEQIGAAALAAPAVALAGRAVGQAISPMFRAAVDKLLGEDIRLTPGQMAGGAARRLENSAASIPILGSQIRAGMRRSIEDFNRAAWNRVLAPLGVKFPRGAEVGRSAAQKVNAVIQHAYDLIIPNLKGQADQGFLTDLSSVMQRAERDLPDAQWATLNKIAKSQLWEKQSAPSDGAALKGIDSELGRQAAGYQADPSFDNRKLGGYISELHAAFRAALERQNPQYRIPLRAANEAYANYVRVIRAASSIGAKDGIFTPAQLGNAVRASDPSLRKMAYGKGEALLQDLADAAQDVLPSNVPDSGTPERAALMAAIGGAAHFDPHTLVAGGALSLPYTSPGMSALRSWAASFPEVAKMLARVPGVSPQAFPAALRAIATVPRQGANILAPGIGLATGMGIGR